MLKTHLNTFKLLLLFLVMAPGRMVANDGVFYAMGNTLFPIRETVVRMDKEILGLTRDGDHVNVSVYFEFFNPGPEKELIVGFVTPRAGGDFPEEESEHPQITGFTVLMNGKDLPYKIYVSDSSGFNLPDSIASGRDFIYHFKALFVKGKNIVRHTYRFRASSGVETQYDIPYVITTGKMWAGGSIADFTLNINMGTDCYFTVPNSFVKGGQPAAWQIKGRGKLSANKIWFIEHEWRTAFIRNGILTLNEKKFAPDTNLSVAVWQLHNEVYLWRDDRGQHEFQELIWDYVYGDYNNELHERSGEELRLLRNYPYARKGYFFQDKSLREYFAQFNWYLPEPALKQEDINLSKQDQEIIQLVRAEEERRKGGQ